MRTIEYLQLAYQLALNSPDPSNQCGAVLTDANGLLLGQGWNDFPGAWPQPIEDRAQKLLHIEHAERAAIYQAARQGNALVGSTLYCPWVACMDCARAIVLSGVKKIYCHSERMSKTPERWQAQISNAYRLMGLSGIRLEAVSGFSHVPVLVNGEIWPST